MKELRIAIVGATGMVGRMFRTVLEERNIQANYTLFASKRSAGNRVPFMGKDHIIEELNEESFTGRGFDYALFSAGGSTSETYAPVAAQNGAIVIDNSSFWRMDTEVPLVVPEVNAEALDSIPKGIVANPNCSTIQAVLPLKALKPFGLKRVIYSTYQAVSGAGQRGYEDLEEGLLGKPPQKFPYPIAGNCIPQIDVFLESGYTKEEQKMIEETQKILSLPDLKVTATCVRVPVYHGHSESINVELEKSFEMQEIMEAFRAMDGLVVEDDPASLRYPMPLMAAGADTVYIGRIHRDVSTENGVAFWCVADNIRKGAATNAVQILETLLQRRNER